jgi:acyl carrier protein
MISNDMDINEIKDKIKGFLVDEMEIDPGKIAPEARLKEDLGIDSLEVVDIIVLVEQEFGFKMKPEDFKELKTFDQFCQFIALKLA